MRFSRRVKPVDRIARKGHRGVKPEAVRRADDVVVDGLRNADHRNPFQAELMADRERSVATDDDERVQSHLVEHVNDAFRVNARTVGGRDDGLKWIAGVERAQDRAAKPQDAGDVAWGENARAVELQQSVEAVFKAHAPDSTVPCGLDDSADDGVQPRRITAAGENAKSFNGTHPIRL